VRVIGRRKRNALPAEEEALPPQDAEPETPEWRVIEPEEGTAVVDQPPGGLERPTGPFDQAPPEGPPAAQPGSGQGEDAQDAAGGDEPASPAAEGSDPGDAAPSELGSEHPTAGAAAALTSPEGAAPSLEGDEPLPADVSQEGATAYPEDGVPRGTGHQVLVADGQVGPTVTVEEQTAAAEERHPKHASAQEDPVSSLMQGPGPKGERTLPRVMAVANQKGGVGKTTTTVNLGAALAELGYRVLVIDLDPQGNATTGLGIDARNFERSMYDVIMHETPMEDCIEPTSVRNLFVAPATIDLAGVEIELVPAFSRELRLRKAIERIVDDFDFVMIDCPPSLGLITINGLAAASEVLVPIQCEYYALEGLGQLLRNVHLVASNLNESLEVSAIVLTMYDGRTRLAIDVAAEVREHFKDKVCRNVIPRTIRLSEAPSFGQPITVFDPTSRGAIAYRELAKEVSNGAPKRAG
jgi:chromosome partitioning protein